MCIRDRVKTIAEVYGKKMRLTKVFNGLIRCCSKKVSAVNKVFGSLVYEKEMSVYQDFEYCRSNFKQTIEKTEG